MQWFLWRGDGVEQIEQDQPIEGLSQSWEWLQQSQRTPEPVNHSSFSPQDTADSSLEQRFPQAHPAFSLSAGEAPGQEALVEYLLSSLDGAAHELASAEGASILPVALREFLALCRARRGFVLLRPEGAAASRVEVMQRTSASLAERCAQEPCFWAVSPGNLAFVPADAGAADAAGEQKTPETCAQGLADAGAAWYAWLLLALPGGGEVALVALGNGNLPSAVERSHARLAGAVLGGLVSAALERDQLRHLLVQEEHARDEFIGLASHELRSPLTIIKGYSQLLLRQARRADHGGDIDLSGLEAISQQVSRMSQLVTALLDFSRIERGTLEVMPTAVDVIALARHAVEQRQRALPDVTFHLTASEPELIALADRARLEQVLGYLLDNAAKFGQEEGTVEVTVRRARTAALLPAHAEGSAQDEVALISVRDYGPGLPDGERDKLFTAFYRGPERSFQRQLAGLGLSLYLSRYLVARQHGYLWADFPINEHATGSVFHVAVPLLPAA